MRDVGSAARIVVIGQVFRLARRAADDALRLLALAAMTRDQQNVQMLHIEFDRGGHNHTNSWRGAALPTVRGVRWQKPLHANGGSPQHTSERSGSARIVSAGPRLCSEG